MNLKTKIHQFFTADNPHGNVVFNFSGKDPIDELSIYALGYHVAGKTLVEKLESKRGYCDYDAYPIFFLYRHSLELYLKAIVYRGAILLGMISNDTIDTDKLLTKHGLSMWLPAIKAIFKRLKWDKDFGIPNIRKFEDFANLVNGIEKIDPLSYSFRYPVNTKGEAALPKHLVLNAIAFGKNMDRVLSALDGAITGLDDHLDVTAQELSEFRELMM